MPEVPTTSESRPSRPRQQLPTPAAPHDRLRRAAYSPRARLVAAVTGLLGVLLAIATPLLPVDHDDVTIEWPQETLAPVVAPLTAYAPIELHAEVPCAALARLPETGSVLLSTTPQQAGGDAGDGMFIRRAATGRPGEFRVEVAVRSTVVLTATGAQLTGCRAIRVDSTSSATTVTVDGAQAADGSPLTAELNDDKRPQVTGVYTDLSGSAADVPGLTLRALVDNRYSTGPTLLKKATVALGILATLASLVALAVIDAGDSRRHRRIFPARWWRLNPRDQAAIGVLALWHIVGANTSDDGYLLTMSRVAGQSDYTANYFRWFGAPETPFGWYYSIFTWFGEVSWASPWIRLPALGCGIAVWLIVSHEVLPRLGRATRSPLAGWTALGLFLAFWLPYNNGLRPEPVICLGALLTWCSVERAIATGRLLPAAVACAAGAFSVAAGPTGIIAVAALLAGSRSVVLTVAKRARELGGGVLGHLAVIAPLVAGGASVVYVAFADLTFAAFRESSAMKTDVGPSSTWSDEFDRYTTLVEFSANGSIGRRFAVFTMLVALIVCITTLLRRSRVPGTSLGPSRRLVGITVGALLLLVFTPTKLGSHHFGVFAGLAAGLAGLAAVAVSPAVMNRPRNRALFAATVFVVVGFTFAGPNAYWFASAFGMPWEDNTVSLFGPKIRDIALALALVSIAVAGWRHFREPFQDTAHRTPDAAATPMRTARATPTRTTPTAAAEVSPRRRRLARVAAAPLALACLGVIVFEIVTAIVVWPIKSQSFSIPQSNVAALTGNGSCGLAEKVLVERDANRGFLTPAVGDALATLTGPDDPQLRTFGFEPDGFPTSLESWPDGGSPPGTTGLGTSRNPRGTDGGQEPTRGVNGSRQKLPFGLDRAVVPVLGSYHEKDQVPARLTTGWYLLPSDTPSGPPSAKRQNRLITVSAAGSFESEKVLLEYSRTPIGPGGPAATRFEPAGTQQLIDTGPAPSWRNLRYDLSWMPAGITAVRIRSVDDDLSETGFIALTPPRVPELQTLDSLVGHDDPTLVDWSSGLSFPCQRPFVHHDGIAEVPGWRISTGKDFLPVTSWWEGRRGGGPLGWLEAMAEPTTVPGYLLGDLGRDWGSLVQFTPYGGTTPAHLTRRSETWSGLYSPAPIKTPD